MLLSIFFYDFMRFNLLWKSSLGDLSVCCREGAPIAILGSIFLLLSVHSYNSSKVSNCNWELLEYFLNIIYSTFREESCLETLFLLAKHFYFESKDLSRVLSYLNLRAPDFLLIIGSFTIGLPSSNVAHYV